MECLYLILVLYFACLGIHSDSPGLNFTRFHIDFVKVMHREYCSLTPVCVPPEPPPPLIFFENGTVIFPNLDNLPFPDPPPPDMNDGSCCNHCSCDIDHCKPYGTCCPDLFDYLPSVEESASKIRMACQTAALKKDINYDLPKGQSVWMSIKCANGYDDDPKTKDKCENARQFTGWDIIIPVAETGTNTNFYQNVYCALCNNVPKANIVNWKVSLECSKSKHLPSSMETLIDEVKALPDCNIIYNPPFNISSQKCNTKISECNTTGLWKTYDAVTEAACHAYTALYDGLYNNIFCFLCNEAEPFSFPVQCVHIGNEPVWPSFSALLKFTTPQEENDFMAGPTGDGCHQNQIFDEYKNICRDLFCLPPKTVIEGNCFDTVNYLTGVSYEAFLKLVPNDSIITVQHKNSTVMAVWEIYQAYIKDMGVGDLIYEYNLYYKTTKYNETLIDCFVLHCKLYFDEYSNLSNVFLNNLLSLEKEDKLYSSEGKITFKMILGQFDVPEEHHNSMDNIYKSLTRIDGILPPLSNKFSFHVFDTKPTLITKVQGCPLIKLEITDYEVENDASSSRNLISKFPQGSFISVNQSGNLSVYVCADDFLASFANSSAIRSNMDPTADSDGLPQGILSLVCTCISVLCLILTFITYVLFCELRTQPGINNMALVICLIIAQVLFQFGSTQAKYIPEWSCQAIGILIHFFWLMVILWMNVCSIHMYLVFIAIRRLAARRNTLKQTVIYTTCTICTSTVIVLINIVVSVAHADFHGIGYGGSICYISDYRMVGYVFAIPVGIILIVNFALFIAVIIKTWRMPAVNSETKHNRNLFAIYAKLSTITGITWIFGFIYFFTKIAVFEYLFIILNASQGVFLFLAFICNKRVLNLYKSRLGQIKTSWPESLSTYKTTRATDYTDVVSKATEFK